VKVLIIGAGGHGQTILDAIFKHQKIITDTQDVGFLDDTEELTGKQISGVPILGTVESLPLIQHDSVILGIGDNKKRKELFIKLSSRGENIVSVIHPTAVIAHNVHLGKGCYIGPNVIIGVETLIEDNVILSGGSIISHHAKIESHTHVGPGVKILRNATINAGAFIGAGAILLPDSSLGPDSSLMAGSILSGKIGGAILAGGSPARVITGID
jgi:sugar O-acyltransferase (sialic acid O-acetyltransferase NeuD family)